MLVRGQDAFIVELLKDPLHVVPILVAGVAEKLEQRDSSQPHPSAELSPHEWVGRRKPIIGLTFSLIITDHREVDSGARAVGRKTDNGDRDARKSRVVDVVLEQPGQHDTNLTLETGVSAKALLVQLSLTFRPVRAASSDLVHLDIPVEDVTTPVSVDGVRDPLQSCLEVHHIGRNRADGKISPLMKILVIGLQNHDLMTAAEPFHQRARVASFGFEASSLRDVETEPRDTDVDIPHAHYLSSRVENAMHARRGSCS